MENILFIDKEKDWTSFDVVAKVRSISGIKKVGHAGTLDPFATGLLIVLVGKDATKKQDEFMKLDKEYEAVLELGKTSTTGDPEGEIKQTSTEKYQIPNKDRVNKILKEFIGGTEQIPPIFSAIKINGKKAYELARKGKEVKLKSRKVKIYSIELLNYDYPFLKLKINCGSGTYIRALAFDIGERLKAGAYLTELRRTKIGLYDIKDAKKVSEIKI